MTIFFKHSFKFLIKMFKYHVKVERVIGDGMLMPLLN